MTFMRFALFYLLLISSVLAITPAEFNTAVKEGIDKVDEFVYLRAAAKDLGIKKIYLFGGKIPC